MSPVVRLLARSMLAGVLAGLAHLQASGLGSAISGEEAIAALIAGGIAFCLAAGAEAGTPLNKTVGVGKN